MAQTSTDERLAEGTVIDGRYAIERLLGSGGFANVYLAKHQILGTDVAIKVLHAPLASASDNQFAARFEREAKVAARMRHPNVVGVTDFGFLDGGDPFLVMEYLEGIDLEEELREHGTLDTDRMLRLMVPCIQAIGEAHRQGVVHKDLKPSNLFLVDRGLATERLVVLDFGVARVFDDQDANITQTGAFTGTPAYLPPEYIREQKVTTAFDVYQMGLILIECLTGQKAIEAEGAMGFLLAHCMGRLTVEPAFFQNDLGRVIQRAIAIEDTQRYPDCSAMAEALAQVAPPRSFDGKAFVTSPTPMSSGDVAAFADTLSSGQIVGDSFVTGDGTGAHQAASGTSQPRTERYPQPSQSGQIRPHSPTATVEMESGQTSNTGLFIIAAVALLAVVAAGAGLLAVLDSNAAAVAGADAGVVDEVDPFAAPDDGIEVISEGTEAVAEGLVDPEENEGLEEGTDPADPPDEKDDVAAEEGAAQRVDAGETEKTTKTASKPKRKRPKRTKTKKKQPKEEPRKTVEKPAEKKPSKRLLVVD